MKIRINNEYYKYYRKNLDKHSLNRLEFTKAIEFVNFCILEELFNGKEISIPKLGVLRVLEKIRRRPVVDFPTTKKNKQKILDEGGTPYKQWKDEKGNITNNGGEHYLAFYTNDKYYMITLGANNNKLYNEESTRYDFKPVKGAITRLNQEIKQGDLKLLLW